MAQARNNIDQTSELVKEFLDSFEKKKTTSTYKAVLKNFFDFIGKTPEDYLVDVRLLENGEKIKQMDKYERHIRTFCKNISQQGKAPKSINLYMSCIRVFFEFNHIFLERTFWKSTKRRGRGKNSKAISDEKNLSHDIIRQVLAHAKLNLKTIILVNSSSGMRIGETLQLTLDHIDFDSSPTKITLDAHMTKNREKRITFISDEATRHLKEWLKVRDDYLKTACARTHIKSYHDVLITKSADDDRVFPMSDETVRKMWNRVLRILELDETDRNTNIHKYKVHGLRKFFRNNFVKGGNGSITDACEQLMGHSGYLDGTYEHQSEEQLKEAYLQAVNHLLIIDQPMATPEAEDKIKKLEKELQHMKVLAEEQVRNYQAPQPAEIERQLIEEQHKNDELQKVLKANQEQYDKLWSVVQNLQQQMSSQ